MYGGGEDGPITQDAMGNAVNTGICADFGLCSYYVKISLHIALLRNVKNLVISELLKTPFDVHGSVHHNTNLTEMTNKMQLCRTIYYSIVS
jgi:hypothetical protein